jgi:hypothetical protein
MEELVPAFNFLVLSVSRKMGSLGRNEKIGVTKKVPVFVRL